MSPKVLHCCWGVGITSCLFLNFSSTIFTPLCLSLDPLGPWQLGREEPGKENTDSFEPSTVCVCVCVRLNKSNHISKLRTRLHTQRKKPCGRPVNSLFTGWQALRMCPCMPPNQLVHSKMHLLKVVIFSKTNTPDPLTLQYNGMKMNQLLMSLIHHYSWVKQGTI